jgi:hypothetical protein
MQSQLPPHSARLSLTGPALTTIAIPGALQLHVCIMHATTLHCSTATQRTQLNVAACCGQHSIGKPALDRNCTLHLPVQNPPLPAKCSALLLAAAGSTTSPADAHRRNQLPYTSACLLSCAFQSPTPHQVAIQLLAANSAAPVLRSPALQPRQL